MFGSRKIANHEEMPEIISRVMKAQTIVDLSIKEISTEEIIRNIYEKGDANSNLEKVIMNV